MLQTTHRVHIADAHAHLLGVETTLVDDAGALPDPLVVFMPVWTPGSYLVREYARHVEGMTADADGRALGVAKVRKNAWRINHGGAKQVTIRYRLYANDLTVRTNHVDATHAYWNGAATYLAVEGASDAGARVVADMPEGWSVATALERVAGPGPATFVAQTFDERCDSPVECGTLIEKTFDALGKPHTLAIWASPDSRGLDWDRVVADTRTIVETEARLFAGDRAPETALPYERYLFIWHVSPRGRGGLEHRASSTLLIKPDRFASRSGYLDLLSLVAHEFFHLWNVKRIRPAGLSPYRYEEENYTRMLWWFEGATSYYDFRTLRLAKLCTSAEYLAHLAEEITRLEDTPGARVHSLENSSYDAWIKAYRPDENSVNSTVSYYLKGEIVCALLDLELRKRSQGRASLDDVLRHLWRAYGAEERAVPEGAMKGIFKEICGSSLDDRFASWVESTDALDVNDVLANAGLSYARTTRDAQAKASLGIRASLDGGRLLVDAVLRGSAAQAAGIDPHDEIVAIGDRRVAEGRIDAALAGLAPGASTTVTLARDGRLRTVVAKLDAAPAPDGKILARADATAEQRALYAAWMGEDLGAPAVKVR